MKKRFTITQAVRSVAEAFREYPRGDNSPTTIRCAINDCLDAAEKDGFTVNFDFDQPRAVAQVRKLIAA
jgi:hypothetical protein